MIPVLIVPVLARPELLYRMVASIDHPVGHLLIIDNGDVVGTPPDLPGIDKVSVVRLPSNIGVGGAWNLGIRLTPHAPSWTICNFDIVFPPGALERFAAIKTGGLVLSAAAPPWACFTIHDEAVAQVGLFDECGFYPAYYEDLDMERRIRAAGIPVVQSDVYMHHDNSSTIASIPNRNAETFAANQRYYLDKVQRGDLSPGQWSLRRRRELAWDR